MSYIDTFDHELLGFLNGMPIYHPLENNTVGSWGSDMFSCSPSNLVMGGGGGEHPGLVVHHLEMLVGRYLLHDIDMNIKFFSDNGYLAPKKQLIDKLVDVCYIDEKINLELCGWSMNQITEFSQNAKSTLHSTPLSDNQSVESWIELSLGEFIYFSLPDLNPLQAEFEKILQVNWPVGFWMNNVSCPPPNYIKSKSQSMSANDSFKLRGYFRWDYQFPAAES